jgi:hypothetical protein
LNEHTHIFYLGYLRDVNAGFLQVFYHPTPIFSDAAVQANASTRPRYRNGLIGTLAAGLADVRRRMDRLPRPNDVLDEEELVNVWTIMDSLSPSSR